MEGDSQMVVFWESSRVEFPWHITDNWWKSIFYPFYFLFLFHHVGGESDFVVGAHASAGASHTNLILMYNLAFLE